MKRIILSEEEIQEICKRLGNQITEDLKNETKTPVILGVMKGACNFMMDLIKNIKIPVYVDYIRLSSYDGMETTGKVNLVNDLSFDIQDRTVIIVEDVVDTGISMNYLVQHLNVKYAPKEVKICSLFDKVAARKKEVNIAYVGKVLNENVFLIGYGLDYNELERNLPYVYEAEKADVNRLDEIAKK